MVAPETIEALLWEDEGSALDFKERQYPFVSATDDQKSEIIKDILAFANSFRRSDAYIVLGVRDVKGGRGIVVGVDSHLEEHNLQQLVNSKTNRIVEFSYHAVEMDEKQVGLIRVPRQERPSYLRKGFGRLQAEAVYVRRGTSTSKATPEEIKRMGAEDRMATNPHADAEVDVLTSLLRHARFCDRAWQLIEDISNLPHRFIVANPRPPEYAEGRRNLTASFNHEYQAFRSTMSASRDVLQEKRAIASTNHQRAIDDIVAAIADVCATVETLVASATDTYASHHTGARDAARNAADALSKLVARQLVSHGET